MKLTAAEFAERTKQAKASSPRLVMPWQVRAVEGQERVLEFVASTEKVASDGMIIQCGAWLTERFITSGAFLWAHNRSEDKPPIGVPVSAAVDTQAKCLRVRVRFAKAEDYAFADTIWRLYADGIMRAVSVSFRILDMADPTPSEREGGAWGVVTKAELYELSAVPVGADADALVAKAASLRTVDADALDVMAKTAGAEPVFARAFGAAALALRAAPGALPTPAAQPAPAAAPKARANRSDACATLRDMVTTLRGAADLLASVSDELAAADAPAGGESAQAATAEATRLAVEAATAPLLTEIRDLRRALALGSLASTVRGKHAA